MYDLLKEFIKPELLILVPVLYLIGMGIKKSEYIEDKNIPVLLGLVGVVSTLLYIVAQEPIPTYKEILMAIFTSLTQGILIAGASVYVNQIIKQNGKSD